MRMFEKIGVIATCLTRNIQQISPSCICVDVTNVTNMMAMGTGYCIYLSLHGQSFTKIHAQVLHGMSYVDSLFSNLKLDLSFIFN